MQRFGAGYRVSLGLSVQEKISRAPEESTSEDPATDTGLPDKTDESSSVAGLQDLVKSHIGSDVKLEAVSKLTTGQLVYVHFHVPPGDEGRLPAFFGALKVGLIGPPPPSLPQTETTTTTATPVRTHRDRHPGLQVPLSGLSQV